MKLLDCGTQEDRIRVIIFALASGSYQLLAKDGVATLVSTREDFAVAILPEDFVELVKQGLIEYEGPIN